MDVSWAPRTCTDVFTLSVARAWGSPPQRNEDSTRSGVVRGDPSRGGVVRAHVPQFATMARTRSSHVWRRHVRVRGRQVAERLCALMIAVAVLGMVPTTHGVLRDWWPEGASEPRVAVAVCHALRKRASSVAAAVVVCAKRGGRWAASTAVACACACVCRVRGDLCSACCRWCWLTDGRCSVCV